MIDGASASGATITWYTTSISYVTSYVWNVTWSGLGSGSAYGNSVYWIKDNATLYGTSGFPVPTSSVLASSLNGEFQIETNGKSMILEDNTQSNLYRVPLPAGVGSGSPPLLAGVPVTSAITEDDAGLYWVDSSGGVYVCTTPPSCTSRTTLATGLQPISNAKLYQDTTALYWITSQFELIRLAK